MDFSIDLKNTQKLVEDKLTEYMNIKGTVQQRVFDAMSYSLLAGGKRLRPVIMLYTAQLCGGDMESILPFACAMEMIHTYSLIHDDLPAMDNDDLRRGKPTNHVMFDEATAILAGDALLNMAFEITSEISDIPAENVLKAVNVLAKSAGAYGMIGGQIIDIESENKELELDELKYLHSLKTGAIIRSSGVCGALLSGASEDEIKAIDEYCLNLGIAFQIRDDILDVTGTTEALGKPVGSDAANNKNTYVSIVSLEKAEELADVYTKRAVEALGIFGERVEKLIALADMLIKRNN